ncbi:MAG: hypothetical protein QOE48_3224 [Mycobacterium sp.]|jgi:hypothetical protein|nr:hypothetical protein [Mycobacterium sp.]MDT5307546.1 hypothetical protein [Mycobacterium sp.]
MRLLLCLAGLAVAVGVAVPASADPPPPPPDNPGADGAFLDSLNKAGMTYNSGPNAITAGRKACDFMNQGLSQNDLVEKLSLLNPGLNSGGAMKFAALASSAYCPDFLNRSSTQNNSPYPGFKGALGGS